MARALGSPLRGASPSRQGDDPPRLSGGVRRRRDRGHLRERVARDPARARAKARRLSDEEIRSYLLTAVANHASKELRRRSRRPTAPLEAIHRPRRPPLPDERAASSRTRESPATCWPPPASATRGDAPALRLGARATPGLRAGEGPFAAGLPQGDHAGVDELTEKLRLVERGEWCADREPVLKAYAAGLADAEQQRQARAAPIALPPLRRVRRQAQRPPARHRRLARGVGAVMRSTTVASRLRTGWAIWSTECGIGGQRSRQGPRRRRRRGRQPKPRACPAAPGAPARRARVSLAKLAGFGTAGKLAAVCLGGGAAATVCLAAGLVPAELPGGVARTAPNRPAAERRSSGPSRPPGRPRRRSRARRHPAPPASGEEPVDDVASEPPPASEPEPPADRALGAPGPAGVRRGLSSAWPRRPRRLAFERRRRIGGLTGVRTVSRCRRCSALRSPARGRCGDLLVALAPSPRGERRRAHLHRPSVPSAEPRPRRLDPRGRPRLCDASLLRRPSERPRDQGHQHAQRAARPLGPGAVADRIAAPGTRVRGPAGEASTRQGACRAPVDGRSAPERGRPRRQRRPTARPATGTTAGAPAGHGARSSSRASPAKDRRRCPQSDLAKTWVRDVRLKVADYSDPSFTALDGTLLVRVGFGARRTCALRPTIPAAAYAQLVVTVNGGGSRKQLELRPAPGHLLRGAFRVVPGDPSSTTSPDTALAPFHDGQNSCLGLRSRLRRQPCLRAAASCRSTTRRRGSHSGAPRTPTIPS